MPKPIPNSKPATDDAPTSASSWKKASSGGPLVVPSGHTALVRPVGLQVLVASKKIPNSLMKFVSEALNAGKTPSMDSLNLDDENTLIDMMNFMDRVVIDCVIEPKVHPIPAEDEEGNPGPRDENLLYVDEVDQDDKAFIFQFALGGTRDLEQFREESAAVVGTLPNVSGGQG